MVRVGLMPCSAGRASPASDYSHTELGLGNGSSIFSRLSTRITSPVSRGNLMKDKDLVAYMVLCADKFECFRAAFF